MKGITKRFPGTLALDHVDLTVRRGEIHALVGQNGAGKSTLVKILAGDYHATAGSIEIDGQLVDIHNTREARRLGIGIVYQELSLLPNLTVAENIALGHEPVRGFVIDQRSTLRRAREALARMSIEHIDMSAKVGTLALPERQLVEIAKVLSLDPRILILDEPTAPLTQTEADRLFSILSALKQHGLGIIYITHRFKEILSLCDRGTVLREGRVVGVFETKDITLDHLVDLTLGRKAETFFRRSLAPLSVFGEEPLLVVKNLAVGHRVHRVSFTVHRGEIVGICGLLGAGQSELGRALFGDRKDTEGTIELKGRPIEINSPHQARQLGIGFLSDSRREEGIFPDLLTEENIGIASLATFILTGLLPFLRKRALRRRIVQIAKQTNVAVSALSRPVRLLSGGNQQKALLARWLMRDADILVLLEPTRGVDVGTKQEVYKQLDALAREGKGIVVVSTDIPEILGISDKILVMHHGSIAATMNRAEATEEKVVRAMQGVHVDGSAESIR
jgi:ribose transport system ATP-binding protein